MSTISKSQPAFLQKLYSMLDDSAIPLIHWTNDGTSFSVSNTSEFSDQVLPRFFKHSNFQSFVRQLNMYGFHKVNNFNGDSRPSTSQEFQHPSFVRGRPELLSTISRKSTGKQSRSTSDFQDGQNSFVFTKSSADRDRERQLGIGSSRMVTSRESQVDDEDEDEDDYYEEDQRYSDSISRERSDSFNLRSIPSKSSYQGILPLSSMSLQNQDQRRVYRSQQVVASPSEASSSSNRMHSPPPRRSPSPNSRFSPELHTILAGMDGRLNHLTRELYNAKQEAIADKERTSTAIKNLMNLVVNLTKGNIDEGAATIEDQNFKIPVMKAKSTVEALDTELAEQPGSHYFRPPSQSSSQLPSTSILTRSPTLTASSSRYDETFSRTLTSRTLPTYRYSESSLKSTSGVRSDSSTTRHTLPSFTQMIEGAPRDDVVSRRRRAREHDDDEFSYSHDRNLRLDEGHTKRRKFED